MRIVKLLLLVAFVLGIGAVSSRAQTSTSATVLGTVRDSSNAVVAGAQVTLRNVATNATAVQVTNSEGYYTFLRAEPGSYVISAKAAGFESATVLGLNFDVSKSYTVDVALKVGSTATVVSVTAEAAIELQTTSATIGNVIGGNELVTLPTISRSALELLTLQPGSTPLSSQGDNSGENGGSVTGARSDQNATVLDGIDISDIFAPGQPTGGTVVPINVEALAEFRVGVANPNVTVASGAGGQVSVVSKGGANSLHGSVYWYVQNTAFNANTWENNHTLVDGKPTPRPVVHDNRGGFALGGPIKKDKTFFFLNYEPRRYIPPGGGIGSTEVNLPSADFRNGIINFVDSMGNPAVACLQSAYVISLNLTSPHSSSCSGLAVNSNGARISSNCGVNGTVSCDPRGLGMSPTVAALVNSYKVLPGDKAVNDGIGCSGDVNCQNISGYLYNLGNRQQDDAFNVRLDHNFTQNLHFFGRYAWFREIAVPSGTPPQLDLTSSTLKILDTEAIRGDGAFASLEWAIRTNLVNSFRFGWVRQRIDNDTFNEAAIAAKLALPGSKDSSGVFENFQIGNSQGNSETEGLGQPIQPAAVNGFQRGKNIQFGDDINWIKGSHTLLFGGDFRWTPTFWNADINQGARSTPTDFSDFVGTSASGPGVDSQAQQHVYETMLGLIAQSTYYQQLNSSTFQPVSGHPIGDYETHAHDLYFFIQDTWRIKPSITFTYGLAWGVQSPFSEEKGRGVVLVPVDPTTGVANSGPIDPAQMLATIKQQALAGTNWYASNAFGYVPYGKLGMSGMWKTDYTDWQPRVSVAWSPSSDSGLMGKLLGNSKTVIRAGYALVYDRNSGATLSHLAAGQPGFNVIPSLATPTCDKGGTFAPGCVPNSLDPASSIFRAGFDGRDSGGNSTLIFASANGTPAPTATNPYVPGLSDLNGQPFSTDPAGNAIFTYDPNFKMGQNHMIDFSIQRELPGNMIMEIGYIGRLGRRLPIIYPVNADPYMFTVGGQSFAQANDCVAQTLRYGLIANWSGMPKLGGIPCQDSSGNILPQPFFETYLGAGSTAGFVADQGSNMAQGNIGGPFGGTFGTMARIKCGVTNPTSLAGFQQCSLFNQQVLDMQVRASHDISNYHALTVTLRNRGWRGLSYDLNYTFSRSLDQGGRTQGFTNGADDPWNVNAMYGPSYFDRTHVFNGVFNYNLPFGQGHKLSAGHGLNRIIGGWSMNGIFRANSGVPLVVAESSFAFGSGLIAGNAVDLIPTGHSYTTGLNTRTDGAAATGTCANFVQAMGGNSPVVGGGGYNYFSDPAAAYCSFRPVLLTVDSSLNNGRDGRDHPLRGFGMWNVDSSFGKDIPVTERFKMKFSADFFNLFNHVSFDDPLAYLGPTSFIDSSRPQNFGVIKSSATPPQRPVGSRWVQLGLRVEF